MKAVIIHGAYGMPLENWFPWLADELAGAGFEVCVPWFPTPEGQHLDTWLSVVKEDVGQLDGDTVLIGHSLGVAFILRLVERAQTAVRGCFMVAGFLGPLGIEEFDNLNASFFEQSFDWARIRERAGVVTLYHAENDPYVPPAMGRDLAQKLGVDLNLIEGAGHFNLQSGYDSFDRLRDDIFSLVLTGVETD